MARLINFNSDRVGDDETLIENLQLIVHYCVTMIPHGLKEAQVVMKMTES